MLKIHNLTPDNFHSKYRLSNQRATLFSDYCHILNVPFMFDEDSNLCEVELPKQETFEGWTRNSDLLYQIDWNYLSKHTSKKLIITHRIIYNLPNYIDSLNELVLKYNLQDRVYWLTFNPVEYKYKHLCRFKLLYLDSLTNVFFESKVTIKREANVGRINLGSYHQFSYGFTPQENNFTKFSIDTCDKHFMSSSRVAKAHRLFATYLINNKIENSKGVVTYHGIEDKETDQFEYLNSHKDYFNSFNIDIDEVINFSSFRGEVFDDVTMATFQENLQQSYLDNYKRCLVNYVNESTSNEVEIFITEKTWVNYAHGRPFILNGNKNTIKWLEKYYGFKSFSSLFDESYDDRDNFVDRVYYSVEELVKFCRLELKEAKQKVLSIQQVIDHNYNIINSLNHTERFLKIFDEV